MNDQRTIDWDNITGSVQPYSAPAGDRPRLSGQNLRILQHLQAGETLTQIDALGLFGCFRLASRVNDLRQAGWNIQTTIIKEDGKRYAKYHLPSQATGLGDRDGETYHDNAS